MIKEEKALKFLRLMDDEAQDDALRILANLADDFPRRQALRLVRNVGVDGVELQPLSR